MYTSTKRSSYVSQTTDLVSIAVFLGVRECTLVTKRSSYVSQTTDLKQFSTAVFFLGVRTLVPCTLVPRDQVTSVKQLILLALAVVFWACVNVH